MHQRSIDGERVSPPPALFIIHNYQQKTHSINRRQRRENESAIFTCTSMLATAVGQALTKYLHDLLDLMFNCGLSEPLVTALSNIADRIKPLSPVIQGK